MKSILVIICAACLLAAGWIYARQAMPPGRPDFQKADFTLTRADGKSLIFHGEVARSADEQAYGLMYLRHLDSKAGMIFPYDPPQEVMFWMKNTLIPLDMLFIGADHKIGKIVSNAVPRDVTPIASNLPVSAVIEIKGGEAARDGLAVGDLASWPSSGMP